MLPLLNRAIFHILVLAPGLRGPRRIGPADTLVSFSAAGGRRARSPFAWCLPGVRCFPVLCVCVCFFSPHRTEFSPRPHTPRVMFSIMRGFRVPSKVSLRLWSWSRVPPPSPGSRGGLRQRLCRCDTGLVGPDGAAPVTRLPLRHRLPFLGSAGGICASVFTGGISPEVFLP